MDEKNNKKYSLSNSMFLRYRLMSLLYLLFLVLAITQVSNSWMPISSWINGELRSEQLDIEIDNKIFEEILSSSEFLSVREGLMDLYSMDIRSEGLIRRNIINGDLGLSLHSQLHQLFEALPEVARSELTNGQFRDDIDNGFLDKNKETWRYWKFLNLTPGLSEMVFEQMVLEILDALESSVQKKEVDETEFWPAYDMGTRFIGDSIPTNWALGKIEWLREQESIQFVGDWHTLTEKDKGPWVYKLLSDSAEIRGEGRLIVQSLPKVTNIQRIETKAFWLPGDTISIYNPLWSAINIPSDVGEVVQQDNDLFVFRIDLPGKYSFKVNLKSGDSEIFGVSVNEIPIPELRTSLREEDLSNGQEECVNILVENSDYDDNRISGNGWVLTELGARPFDFDSNCLKIHQDESKILAIHILRMKLLYRGKEVEHRNHTIKVL